MTAIKPSALPITVEVVEVAGYGDRYGRNNQQVVIKVAGTVLARFRPLDRVTTQTEARTEAYAYMIPRLRK